MEKLTQNPGDQVSVTQGQQPEVVNELLQLINQTSVLAVSSLAANTDIAAKCFTGAGRPKAYGMGKEPSSSSSSISRSQAGQLVCGNRTARTGPPTAAAAAAAAARRNDLHLVGKQAGKGLSRYNS